jgi:molybdopterin-guanine dinucleotide biosynthesis protein A
MPHCEACILAGGLSSRLGTNKSKLRLGRRSLLGHARAAASAAGLPSRIIRADLVPRCGPLGGVYTALATSRAEIVLFLSCDMPFVSANLLHAILARLKRDRQALFVEAEHRTGFPFLVRRAALPVVGRQLARKRFSLQNLTRALRAQTLRVPRRLAQELFNINTLADWHLARKRWRSMTQG